MRGVLTLFLSDKLLGVVTYVHTSLPLPRKQATYLTNVLLATAGRLVCVSSNAVLIMKRSLP